MSKTPKITTIDVRKAHRLINQASESRFKQTHMMKSRPKGWVIMDSWNNKFYPMDIFSVDTMQYNTEKIQQEFHRQFGGSPRDLFLPWHYTVELVNQKPFVTQTRPPMYRSNFAGYSNHFTIMIIGNSAMDIYPGSIYRQIAHMIINPWKHIPSVRVPNSKENITFWTKENFLQDNLLKELN